MDEQHDRRARRAELLHENSTSAARTKRPRLGAASSVGTNTVHFTTGTLASGATTSFQLTLAISPTLTGTLSNTATVTPPPA